MAQTADVRRGRVRIYSLEEVVRLVERGKREIAAHPYTPADIKPIEPITAAQLLLQEQDETQDDPRTDLDAVEVSIETHAPVAAETKAVERGNDAKQSESTVFDGTIGIIDATPLLLDPPPISEQSISDVQAAPSPEAPMGPSPGAPSSPIYTRADQSDEPDQPHPPPQSIAPPANTDAVIAADIVLPDASRLSLEETYLRERAAARLRAREEELRLETEAAARRAEEEEREAREAREQVLAERGRRPYAVGAVGRSD